MAIIRRYFFHFTQAIYIQFVDVGLRNDYVSPDVDPLVKKLLQRLFGMLALYINVGLGKR